SDRESFFWTRRLVREEGIFGGGSAGSALAGAVKYAKTHNLGPDDVMVVLLPDTGARYLSKVFDDEWMRENGFLERAWVDYRARDIHETKPTEELITARPTDLITDVIRQLKQHNISQMPVLTKEGRLAGIVTEIDLLNHLFMTDHKHSADETIEAVINRNVPVVRPNTPLETLMGIFSNHNVAIVAT